MSKDGSIFSFEDGPIFLTSGTEMTILGVYFGNRYFRRNPQTGELENYEGEPLTPEEQEEIDEFFNEDD